MMVRIRIPFSGERGNEVSNIITDVFNGLADASLARRVAGEAGLPG